MSTRKTGERTQLYRGRDPRQVPIYEVNEAARHLHMSPATLRSWVAGRRTRARDGRMVVSSPIIERPDPSDDRLSFTNLIEAHVLRALRVRHSVSMSAVRQALQYAERELGVKRLLANKQLRAMPGEIFLQEYNRLMSLDPAGQYAIERVLKDFLERVVHDAEGLPGRLFPFVRPHEGRGGRLISIDPRVSFGAPVVARKGIKTEFLAGLYNSGESIEDLARYYDLDEEEVREAIIFERAA